MSAEIAPDSDHDARVRELDRRLLLAQDALVRQAEELARSNSALRQFAYSASHDLREPVRQLAVFSELLHEKFHGTIGEEGACLIQHAVDCAHRVEKLLEDLLARAQPADAPQRMALFADTGPVVRRAAAPAAGKKT